MKKMEIALPALIILSVFFVSGCTTNIPDQKITNFEECIKAGYPAMESYPRQCAVPDGPTFTEVIGSDQSCEVNGGTWIESASECEWISKEVCEEIGGTFNECASACRNDPDAQICTLQCVQVCEFTLIGGDKDEGGCLVSAGYSWCEEKQKCLRAWEENCTEEAEKHLCTEEEKGMVACTMDYNPVCGWTFLGVSKTFANSCGACSAKVDYWEAGECAIEGMSPQECEDMGGRTVNIVNADTCLDGETIAGDVQGFISPNICCVPV